MLSNPFDLFLYFTLYSFVGWVCESIWCSVGTGKLVNRGFLTGPYCPIYGFGALIILILCVPLKEYPPLVFVVAMLAATALEYFTGWLLETLFHTRWWDYSHRKFQLKGRICLRNSLLFGLMGVAATYFADPLAERLIESIAPNVRRILAICLAALLSVDLAHTVSSLLGLRKRLRTLRAYLEELDVYNKEYRWLDIKDIQGSVARLREICVQDAGNETAAGILQRLDSLTERRNESVRLLKAFPNMRDKDFGEELKAIRESWVEHARSRKKKNKGQED